MLDGKEINIAFSCLAWAQDGKLVIGDDRGVEWQDSAPSHIENLQDLAFGKDIITGFKTFILMEKFFAKNHFRVVTRIPGQTIREFGDQIKSGRVSVPDSFENAVNFAETNSILVIGGVEIFKFALPYTDYVHRTMIRFGKDTRMCVQKKFFPDYNPNEWKRIHPNSIGWDNWHLHQGDKCETIYEIFRKF